MLNSIRDLYSEMGVAEFYERCGGEYLNPHFDSLSKAVKVTSINWELDLSHTLDLCCGGGEITSVLDCDVGCDPYTHELYRKNTNKPCFEHNFDDIMHGKLEGNYSTIICSYALHLVDKSKLPQIIWQLSQKCEWFLIVSPNKKPEIKEEWGMTLANHAYMNRIRLRLYKSI